MFVSYAEKDAISVAFIVNVIINIESTFKNKLINKKNVTKTTGKKKQSEKNI